MPPTTLYDLLQKLRESLRTLSMYKSIIGEEYSSRAYAKAADLITSPKILQRIIDGVSLPKGIGQKIRSVILEFVAYNSVNELNELRLDPRIIALEKFEKVIGIGPVNAAKFVNMGYTTIEDLKKCPDLNNMQKIGLEYLDRIIARIPRDVIENIHALIDKSIIKADKDAQSLITGSYRRGSMTSGDVDIIVKTDNIRDTKDIIIEGAIDINAGEKKRSLLYPHNNMYVQVDIFLCPSSEWVSCLNYTTGSARHNIQLRSIAQTLGYKLSQNGLFKMPDEKRVQLSSEEELYKILGMNFIDPKDRT